MGRTCLSVSFLSLRYFQLFIRFSFLEFEMLGHNSGLFIFYYLEFFGINFYIFFSLEREEAEDLIKRHGGRVTGSISKKTVRVLNTLLHLWFDLHYWHVINIFCVQNFLLCDEDIGGRKSSKAKELGLVLYIVKKSLLVLFSVLIYFLLKSCFTAHSFSLRMGCLTWFVHQNLQRLLHRKN